MLLSAERLCLRFPDKPLLEGADFYLNPGEKVGVIGANGSGKSTFLKALAHKEAGPGGRITLSQGVRVRYLPQNPLFYDEKTVLETALEGGAGVEYEVKSILTRLGVEDFDAAMGTLSGGQRRRVALAAALASPCELLLLDEPTNHLDSAAIAWLERTLSAYKGGLVMVTHDRYFLERVIGRIVEIDRGALVSYPARYEQYLEMKLERDQMREASMRKKRSLYIRELEWMRQGPKARGSKSRERMARFAALSGAIAPEAAQQQLLLEGGLSRLGKKILSAQALTKSLGGSLLIDRFSLTLTRDARLGVVGPNGCGKSTLLRLLAGRLEPDAGKIEIGETVRIGYFSQESQELDLNLRVIETVQRVAMEVETGEGRLSASQMLERFLFPSHQHAQAVRMLSGGERRRLYLLTVLMRAPNVLIMDEPTNDLDIETIEVLEDYLEHFPGAVIAVSHDRYFLDKIASHILEFSGQGQIQCFLGGYSAYLNQKEAPEQKKPRPAENAAPQTKRPQATRLRFTFKEQREYEMIDGQIEALEQQLACTEQEMEEAASDYSRLQALVSQKESLQGELEERMERWVYLNDLAERIRAQQGGRI